MEEVVPAERLRAFADAVLRAVGMPEEDAALATSAMVWAELHDLPLYGVTGGLPLCVRRILAGSTQAKVSWEPVSESAAVTVMDARSAWGQVAASRAMRSAIRKARGHGIGMSVVRNSSSAEPMGYYPSLAIAERMVGIAMTNGEDRFAIGAPASKHPPLVFASALSVIDPGFALVSEVLTGVLSGGAHFGADVGARDDVERPQGVSLFLVAIDPEATMPYEVFTARVDELIDQDGERSRVVAEQRQGEGIPITAESGAVLKAIGDEVGVRW